MLQRILGIAIGGLITFLLLLLFQGGRIIADTNTGYIVAIVLGGLADFFWPIIIAWRAAKRVKERRENEVQSEVERQMAAQQKPPQR